MSDFVIYLLPFVSYLTGHAKAINEGLGGLLKSWLPFFNSKEGKQMLYDELIKSRTETLKKLAQSEKLKIDENLKGKLTDENGVYRFSLIDGNVTLKVGRTDTSLKQRIITNHYNGDQPGNIRMQLVKNSYVKDFDASKKYLEEKCNLQYLVIENDDKRKWSEHFIISMLQPKFSD